MEHTEKEKGVAQVLLQRLVDQRIPRLLEMKARVEAGELLSAFDIQYLDSALEDANHNHPFTIHFPEYSDIVGRVAQLYEQIASKALENERAKKK